jgi:aspartate aminotransferase
MRQLSHKPIPGMHRYMENAGYTNTRAAVAVQLERETGIKFTGNEVVMTCGAAGALNIAFKALFDAGEELLCLTPNYFEYENYIDNHGGVIKYIPFQENFDPDFNALEAAISPNTKALVLNSPNNPTGYVYSDQVLKQLAEIIDRKSSQLKKRIYIVSDDVYSDLFFGEGRCPRIVKYYPHTILTTSYSKNLSLPGERIGYAAVNPDCEDSKEVVNGLIYANRVMGFINAPAFMQNIISNLQNVSVSIDIYRKKRDFLYENLTKIGYSIVKPEGAFYIFPRSPINDDETFVKELKALRVLTVPGSAFNAPGYFRISFCMDDRTIEGSLDGFLKAIEKYRK